MGAEPSIRAVLGLGNPGPGYRLTRHNLGFLVVERLTERHGLRLCADGARLRSCRWRYGGGGRRIWLATPNTFMNLSGRGAGCLRGEHGVEPAEILVLVDDLDLPFGLLRLRERGGAGTHNGMRSLVEEMGEAFPRLRIGIGPPPEHADLADWVLGEFPPEDRDRLGTVMEGAAACVETAIRRGVRTAMNQFNGPGPAAEADS